VHDYDPFSRGGFPVGVRTQQALDTARNRQFPCEIWYPVAASHAGHDLAREKQDVFTVAPTGKRRTQAAVRDATARPGTYPLVLYSHPSGAHRRSATFLCTHLCSHGYLVAALDHSEVVAQELTRKADETEEQKLARWDAVIASRIPDIRFLLDYVQKTSALEPQTQIDSARIGIVGHSFGAWTALAVNDVENRIRAVVALAPGGTSKPRPGILPVKLSFEWGRDVPTMYLVAENDVALPLSGLYETFDRTPATKRMVVLRRADHMHFVDNVEEMHEMFRQMPGPSAEVAAMQKEMLPISELCSGEHANLFVRGLTLGHFDAVLKDRDEAKHFLAGNLEAELAQRGVETIVHKP
jgi:dienelactone hydrolase